MKRIYLLAVILTSMSYNCVAQEKFLTLRECIELGIQNNLSLKGSEQDIRIANIGRSENRSRLLPVIQGFGNFTNNVHRGTTVTDGTNLGKLLGIDMPYMTGRGLRYSTSGGIQLSMPLYDQTLYTGISIAEKLEEISRFSYEKAKEDLTVEISKLYYLVQTTAEQIRLTQKNISKLEELSNITKAFHDNGMALEVDIKRVNINLENLRVQLDNSKSMYEQQLNLLRYILDLSPEITIKHEPINKNIVEDDVYLYIGLSPTLYELKLLDSQSELIQQQKKAINQGYIPSLSLVGQLSYTNYTDHFENYFKSHPSNKWYNTTYWGLSLRIPVFDGFAKNNSRKKADANYLKLQLQKEDTEKKLNTQYNNALNDWNNNVRNLQKQSDNYTLAEDVYHVTTDQYKEGIVSMSDLLQDELRMSEAQNNYVSALYNYKISELSLLKLTGQLNLITK